MKTYYIKMQVVPTKSNDFYDSVGGAIARCWVATNCPESALGKAEFCVKRHDFEISQVEMPVETTREHFKDKEDALLNYDKAQEKGISFVVVGWAKDGKTTSGPIALCPSWNVDINEFLSEFKILQKKGRCLHFESGKRCGKIIRAHSIQKSGLLKQISDGGHVYRVTADIGMLKRKNGHLSFSKVGINEASTFLGFCEKHDSELFYPIDNFPLKPSEHQIFLYAYRSLCREVFVKENVSSLYKNQLKKQKSQKVVKDFFSDVSKGADFGLVNMHRHKTFFDKSLRNGQYDNIRYVIFLSSQNPIIAFSGVFYPDYDFCGRKLQNLGDQTKDLELVTFCSAPLKSGWAFVFSWHETNSRVCVEFLRSLATMMCEKRKLGDLLFRLVISNCENHAISPQWWEALPEEHKNEIADRVTLSADSLSTTTPIYLTKGLEGIVSWEFDKVISRMD